MVSHLLHVGVARSVEILPSPTLFRVNFGHQFLRQLEDGTLATDAQHAIVTIDEATGAFSCQSGFMDFAYPWHPSRRESDIFTFLASLDFDYFMEKRSEEHTSELQSLMRISYAVFCLKKKNTHQ